MDIELKYGCNPHQGSARLSFEGDPPPLEIVNGRLGYINTLDALGAWGLVRDLSVATGKAAAASFKHVSPAGAAVARPLTDTFRRSVMLDDDEELSPVANAYVRARGGDRLSSFGDVAAVSETVDASLATILRREVSDLIIAPGYTDEALEILKTKREGSYLTLKIDPAYEPPQLERREVFGFTLQQQRNNAPITADMFAKTVDGKDVPADIVETLIVGTVALKYTQSNSVCIAYDGQVIGNGAGQQSRVHCARLACGKADKWFCQQHPTTLGLQFVDGLSRTAITNTVDQYLLWEELSAIEREATLAGLAASPEPLDRAAREKWVAGFDGICLCSDAFIPFRDTVDRSSRTNVQYITQPGGSLRDDDVTAAAAGYGMAMVHNGMRCFLH